MEISISLDWFWWFVDFVCSNNIIFGAYVVVSYVIIAAMWAKIMTKTWFTKLYDEWESDELVAAAIVWPISILLFQIVFPISMGLLKLGELYVYGKRKD